MVSSGTWNVLYFYHNFMPNFTNMRKFPVLASVLKQFGDEFLGGMVCFSSIEPGTCIVPHTGSFIFFFIYTHLIVNSSFFPSFFFSFKFDYFYLFISFQVLQICD